MCVLALALAASASSVASAQVVTGASGGDGPATRPSANTPVAPVPDSASGVGVPAGTPATGFPPLPSHRWLPRVFSIGVGGVATSAPGGGTSYSPALGGAFDASAIGYVTPRVAWRVEAFLHLHDRSLASEPALLADAPERTCSGGRCEDELRETARRTSGASLGLEYHPMRGHVGVYGVAMLGVAGSSSFGEGGRCHGFAPSLGLGLLAPMSAGLDGFALEARWRRVPTVLGVVNAAVLSLELRF